MEREPSRSGAIGVLARGPHPVLFELLYEPALADDLHHVLPWLLRIDAAHVVMLAAARILPAASAAALLGVNRELWCQVQAGQDVLAVPPQHRGLYLLYEQRYIAQLGDEVGGAAHAARSRNDINATVARLRARAAVLDLVGDGVAALRALEDQARRHRATVMSAFTHQQPAQPSTLGHYLAAVAFELARALAWLAATYPTINRCPMGAAAGVGTPFAIDPARVAELLGFDRPIDNSIDAVASRDFAVQALSAAAALGTTLTRLAADLQTWGSVAYGFVGWPDELVSTSSIMPQKRNAYVLENIRGQAVRATGALVATLHGLKGTPFANSVEVSGEAASHLGPGLRATSNALRLTALLVSALQADPAGMRAFAARHDITMTALADLLVAEHGVAFRTAHELVARLVVERPASWTAAAVCERLEALAGGLLGRALELDAAAVARALDPDACMRAARSGGGPAPEAVDAQLAALGEVRAGLETELAARRAAQGAAAAALDAAITQVLDATPARTT